MKCQRDVKNGWRPIVRESSLHVKSTDLKDTIKHTSSLSLYGSVMRLLCSLILTKFHYEKYSITEFDNVE